MTVAQVRRRYAGLTALQILGTSMMLPVLVILMGERGLSVRDVGLVLAVGALSIRLLEVAPRHPPPDRIGPGPDPPAAACLGRGAAFTGLFFASSLPQFIFWSVVFALGRAFESGPLQAWFVERTRNAATTPAEADLATSRGLGRGFATMALGGALGALLGGGLAAALPPEVTIAGVQTTGVAVPLLVAVMVEVVCLVAVLYLVTSQAREPDLRSTTVRHAVHDAARLVSTNRIFLLFACRWLLFAAAFQSFELVAPLYMRSEIGSAGSAASAFSVAIIVTQLSAAAGASLSGRLAGRYVWYRAVGLLSLLAGIAIMAAGMVPSTIGFVLCFALAFFLGGPVSALQGPTLHRQVDDTQRATLLSLESAVANVSVFAGSLALGWLVEATSLSVALVVAGVLAASAAVPSLLIGHRSLRDR